MSREPSRRTSGNRARAHGLGSPRVDRAEWVRGFQKAVLEGLASAKAGRLVDGAEAFERLGVLIEKTGRAGRGRRKGARR